MVRYRAETQAVHVGRRGCTWSAEGHLGELCLISIHGAGINQRGDDVVWHGARSWPWHCDQPVQAHRCGLGAILEANVEGVIAIAIHGRHHIVVDELTCTNHLPSASSLTPQVTSTPLELRYWLRGMQCQVMHTRYKL